MWSENLSTVIGLDPSNQEVNQELQKLKDIGFDLNNIRVLTDDCAIKKILVCDPNRIVAKYAFWGAILGMAVYCVFTLVAISCDCNLYPISQTIAFEIILIGILAGALIGGIIGIFNGLAEYKKDTHLYTKRINVGEKVFVIKTTKGEEDKAIEILHQIGCLGIRVVPKPKKVDMNG